ncbi:hypothetical protein ACRASX_14765 [Flavobacterium sp. TMP13]|uniref:hypothetical protein n=1 Tax=Flavobacterium sp. TMP13 TaxID=3425950 RepID=UPI003D781A41
MQNNNTQKNTMQKEKKTVNKGFRFTKEEMDTLNQLSKEGGYQDVTKLVKDILFNSIHKVQYIDLESRNQRNQLIEEFISIGTNFREFNSYLNKKNIDSFDSNEKSEIIGLLFNIQALYSNLHEQPGKI